MTELIREKFAEGRDDLIEKVYIVPQHFVTRKDFINRTGIFVTPDAFLEICKEFVEAQISAEDFLARYENDIAAGRIVYLPVIGVVKYMVDDDSVSCISAAEDMEPSLYEILDSLSCGEAYWRLRKQGEKVL